MKVPFLFVAVLAIAISLLGCHSERAQFHNKNGKVRYGKIHRQAPWFLPLESGYDKHSRKLMGRWRNLR